jgi:DNA processing protein
MDELRYWIGFNVVKGIGPVKVRALLDHFGSLRAAWAAAAPDLKAAGLDQRSLNSLLAARAQVDLDAVLRRLEQMGLQVLTWDDEAYPANLRHIAQPPPVVYVKGTLLPSDEWAVALVGTRQASAYGREVARQLSAGLAGSSVTVVSGLARGIDAIAHRAALEAGGRTIAVLGSGLDHIYPPEHKALADEIAQAGAVISDYALGTQPESANFPPRNRLISGLAKGVVIVEADITSGALITAEFAAEQGRDVFAVPGSILQRSCRGTNKLIQDGARPVLGVTDVLEALNMTLVTEHKDARTVLPVDPTEQKLLNCLAAEPKHVDDIGEQLNLPIAQITGTLALMELKGLVRQMGGMNYMAAREESVEYRVE